jgi:hypothetical protein
MRLDLQDEGSTGTQLRLTVGKEHCAVCIKAPIHRRRTESWAEYDPGHSETHAQVYSPYKFILLISFYIFCGRIKLMTP